jgi:undecaprenyl-diphosphatase
LFWVVSLSTSWLAQLDVSLFKLINQDLSSEYLDPLMILLSSEALWVVVALVYLVTITFKLRRFPWLFTLAMSVSVGMTDVISYRVLKPAFDRQRPCHEPSLEVRNVKEHCGGKHSLPSNHAANGMAVAMMILLLQRRNYRVESSARAGSGSALSGFWVSPGAMAIFFSFWVGYSRVYLGVHYPGDILLGFITGASVSGLFYLVFRRIFANRIWVAIG